MKYTQIILLILFSLNSCSSKSQEKDFIYRDAMKSFEKKLKIEKDSLQKIEDSPKELINLYEENERSLFEKKLKVKKDFLNTMSSNQMVIIEKNVNAYGGPVHYIFILLEDRINLLTLSSDLKSDKYQSVVLNKSQLLKEHPDIEEIIKFSKNKGTTNFDKASFPAFGIYDIQIVNNGNTQIYKTSAKEIANNISPKRWN